MNVSNELKKVLEGNTTLRKQRLNKYEKLLMPKMDADEAHYIHIGACKFFWKNDEDEEMIFLFALEGEMIFLPDEFMLGIRNEDVYIEMIEDSEVYTITRAQMDLIYTTCPDAFRMTNLIRAQITAKWHLHKRILMEKEGDRYGLFCTSFPELERKNLSEKDLCHFLKIGRTTLTDSKKNWLLKSKRYTC